MANQYATASTIDSPYQIDLDRGATVIIKAEDFREYADVKSAQLHSLCLMLRSDEFRLFSDSIKSNLQWLASDLAEEVRELVGHIGQGGRSGNQADAGNQQAARQYPAVDPKETIS